MLNNLTIRSYAKINWTLDVLFHREDGFHELRTIYQTISLHDEIELSAIESGIFIECDDPNIPCDGTNLIHKAAMKLRDAFSIGRGVRMVLRKRIPVSAGLGGGSSNAAVVLLGLCRLWGIEADETELLQMAQEIGSDVPLFLVGGTVLGVGRGEEIYPLEEVECENLLLVNPGIAVSTADAYGKLSRLTRKNQPRMIPFTLLAARDVRELPLKARNDLERVVLTDYSEIAEVKARLISLGAKHALMSGSGATIFGVFDNQQEIRRAQSELHAAGIWSEQVHTVGRKEYWSTLFM